jgi:predicted DNA-binding protein
MTQQNEILDGVEIVRNGKEIVAEIPLRLTEAKLEVLVEVAKAFGQTLSVLIEESIEHDIRALLDNDVGDALNKKLGCTWLKEIGEAPEEVKKEEA